MSKPTSEPTSEPMCLPCLPSLTRVMHRGPTMVASILFLLCLSPEIPTAPRTCLHPSCRPTEPAASDVTVCPMRVVCPNGPSCRLQSWHSAASCLNGSKALPSSRASRRRWRSTIAISGLMGAPCMSSSCVASMSAQHRCRCAGLSKKQLNRASGPPMHGPYSDCSAVMQRLCVCSALLQ